MCAVQEYVEYAAYRRQYVLSDEAVEAIHVPDLLSILLPSLQTSLNLSHFVARKHWPTSSPSSLHCRAYRLQRREPLRGLLVPMATIFALLQTAIN